MTSDALDPRFRHQKRMTADSRSQRPGADSGLNEKGLVEECNMNMKPALLVAALVAAAAVTVGCEQRGPSDTVGKRMDSAPGKMEAQNAPPGGQAGDSGKMAQPGGQAGDSGKMAQPGGQAADKMAAQGGQAADKIAGAADDTAITAKVKAAILAEPGLKSLQINVDSKGGTVTLSGNVASDNLRDRAKQIAMGTDGVKNVVDNLTVKSS